MYSNHLSDLSSSYRTQTNHIIIKQVDYEIPSFFYIGSMSCSWRTGDSVPHLMCWEETSQPRILMVHIGATVLIKYNWKPFKSITVLLVMKAGTLPVPWQKVLTGAMERLLIVVGSVVELWDRHLDRPLFICPWSLGVGGHIGLSESHHHCLCPCSFISIQP